MKTLKEIRAEQEVIRARLAEIENTPTPGEDADEATRAAFADLGGETDELIGRFEALEEEAKPLQARQDRLDVIRSAQGNPGGIEPGSPPQVVTRTASPFEDMAAIQRNTLPVEDMVARARNAVEDAPRHMSDDGRQRVTTLIDRYAEDGSPQAEKIARHLLMTGSPEYHEEFRTYARSGGRVVGDLMRAAMSLTDANGGYLVPFTLDPTIILSNAGIKGSIRQISRTETIATDTWNGVTSAGVSGEWTAEATEAADASPTFAQPTITPKKADVYVQGSYEVLADSGFASSLGMLLADAKVRLEEAAFATANVGATRPRGVVAAVAAVTASIVTAAATNAFAVGDVYSVSSAMQPRWEDNASWLANKSIMNRIRQFDTAGGSAFWANLGMGEPERLLGQPIYKTSTMQSAVTTGGLVLLCGDFSEYVIVDRVGMSVLYEPMVKGSNRRPTGEAGWYAFWRVGADVTNVDAFRLLQLNTVAAFTALA